MQKRTFIVAGVAAVVAALGALGFSGRASAKNVSLEVLPGTTLATDPSKLVVDIRTPEEWKASGVVEGALLVTYTSAEDFLKKVTPQLKEGQSLTLICRSGNRTSRAARQIAGLVEFPVVDVQGGMIRVVKEGYKPVKATRKMGCPIC